MSEVQEIPLFPLRVVVFPGSRLDLQIFERRYIDLVTQCLKSESGFGICLLKDGKEVVTESSRQTIHRTGTYVKIADWDQLENGLLGITVEGQTKFRINDCWQEDSGLLHAKVEYSVADTLTTQAIPVQEDHAALVDLLKNLASHPMVEQRDLTIDYDNLWDIGWRLSDLMPIELEQRQGLLELDDPFDRIEHIEGVVAYLASDGDD